MASVPGSRPVPTTDRELELLRDLTVRLVALGLTVHARTDRREITAQQPAVTGVGPINVGLSQVVTLARSRAEADRLAWVITIDDGFRGTAGSRFEPIADGDDVATAARKIGAILALTDAPAPDPAPAV